MLYIIMLYIIIIMLFVLYVRGFFTLQSFSNYREKGNGPVRDAHVYVFVRVWYWYYVSQLLCLWDDVVV